LAVRDALLTGGGSGHEPIQHGLVGRHLAICAASSDILALPVPDNCSSSIRKVKPVLATKGNELHATTVGPPVTSQEKAGFPLHLTNIGDERKKLWTWSAAAYATRT
jgi:dihydroxyacetone kinase